MPVILWHNIQHSLSSPQRKPFFGILPSLRLHSIARNGFFPFLCKMWSWSLCDLEIKNRPSTLGVSSVVLPPLQLGIKPTEPRERGKLKGCQLFLPEIFVPMVAGRNLPANVHLV